MIVAVVQLNVVPGDMQANFNAIRSYIIKAAGNGAELVVFPEMSVSGYLLGDMWTDREYVKSIVKYNQSIAAIAREFGISVAYGSVSIDTEKKNRDGRDRVSNVVYLYDYTKNVLSVVANKTNLPTYRMFDDSRYFFGNYESALERDRTVTSLAKPVSFTCRSGEEINIGFSICEDLWCEDYAYKGGTANVTKWLIGNGSDVVINLSASPWTVGKEQARNNRVNFVAKECAESIECGNAFRPFIYCNCCGVQNNGKNVIVFDGSSAAYNSQGEVAVQLDNPFEDYMFTVDVRDLYFTKESNEPKYITPLKNVNKDTRIDGFVVGESCVTVKKSDVKKRSSTEEKYDAIVAGLRGFKKINGWAKDPVMVVGISGGVDSALAAALHVEAFGKENVVGINMPTEYNSKMTISAAKAVADNLGIEYLSVPIENIVKTTKDSVFSVVKECGLIISQESLDLLSENIQAKARSINILSNCAQAFGMARNRVGLYSSNGNKNEILLGYYTLDGDGRGGINPIGDLTKTEVYKMCRFINEMNNKEIIPEPMLPKDTNDMNFLGRIFPSAELKNNQIDPIKFGYHCALIEKVMDYKKIGPATILKWWIDGTLVDRLGITRTLFERYELNKPHVFVTDLRWFFERFRRSVSKRVQGPPIIIVSKTSFGYDLRESILPDFGFSEEADLLALSIGY